MHRIFTEEERTRLNTHPAQRALEALDRGDVRSAQLLAVQLSTAHYQLYFGYLHWIARMLGMIYRERGVEALHQALRCSVSVWLQPALDRFRTLGWTHGVRGLILPWRSDLGRLEIRESTERVVILRRPCGSGGRLLLEGWYTRVPGAYPLVKETHPITRGQTDFPLFCTACEVVRELSQEVLGAPLFRVEGCKSRPAGACSLVFSKDPGNTTGLCSGGDSVIKETDPVFPEDEIAAWEDPLMERAQTYLRAGRINEAKRLFELFPAEWKPLHDTLVHWSASLLSFVYRTEGAGGVQGCIETCYDPVFRNVLELMKIRDDRANIEFMADVLHSHYMAGFEVEEEEDRFTFHLKTCGSGGMLVHSGLYGHAGGPARVAGEHACSFSMKDLPVYCTHCAMTNRYQIRNQGPFGFVTRPGNFLRKKGDSLYDAKDVCKFIYFKGLKGDCVDQDLFEQVRATEVAR